MTKHAPLSTMIAFATALGAATTITPALAQTKQDCVDHLSHAVSNLSRSYQTAIHDESKSKRMIERVAISALTTGVQIGCRDTDKNMKGIEQCLNVLGGADKTTGDNFKPQLDTQRAAWHEIKSHGTCSAPARNI